MIDKNFSNGSSNPVKITFMKHSLTAILPMQMTAYSSCLDLYADEDIFLENRKIYKVVTNISVNMPLNFELQIRPRSSLAAKGIIVIFGTVDADYKAPLLVIVHNASGASYDIKKGDRIAQMKLVKNENILLVDSEGKELPKSSDERKGGFGSTS